MRVDAILQSEIMERTGGNIKSNSDQYLKDGSLKGEYSQIQGLELFGFLNVDQNKLRVEQKTIWDKITSALC